MPASWETRYAPAGLWKAVNVRVTSTGVPWLDEQLGGGWRQGEISEIVGGRSSGKTSVLLSSLAAATAGGGVAALVDAVDRLDPLSLQETGVDLSRVLWVRGAAITIEMARAALIEDVVSRAVRAFDLVIRAGGFSLVALDLSDVPSRYVRALPWATWKRLAYANEGQPTVGAGRRPGADGPKRPRRVVRDRLVCGLDGHERSEPPVRRIREPLRDVLLSPDPRADVALAVARACSPRVRVYTSRCRVRRVRMFAHHRAADTRLRGRC